MILTVILAEAILFGRFNIPVPTAVFINIDIAVTIPYVLDDSILTLFFCFSYISSTNYSFYVYF